MRKVFVWSSCLCFLISVHNQAYAEKKPTYNQLIQEQIMIYELNRTTEKNKIKIKKIKSKINTSSTELKKQKNNVENLKKDVKETLLSYNESDVLTYGETLASLKHTEDVARFYQIMDVSLEEKEQLLTNFNDSYNKLQKEERKLEKQERTYKKLNKDIQKKLADIQKREQRFQKDLQMMDDIEKAKKEVECLLIEWQEKGLPTFSLFFKSMNRSVSHISSYVSKDDVKAKGLFTYEIEVKEKTINDFLKQENKLFNDVSFSFKNGLVQGKGTYEGLSILIEGRFVLTKKQDIAFNVDKLVFQGVTLPPSTIEDFEQRYRLRFSPQTVLPKGSVKKVTVVNHAIRIEVGLN